MEPGLLQATDIAGGTFYLLAITLLASSILCFLGAAWVPWRYKVATLLAGVTMLVAFLHYAHAAVIWSIFNQTPIVYRYIDWMLTIPLQVVTVFFFARAAGQPTIDVFWRILIVAVLMTVARYLGEAGYMNTTLGFLIGLVGWLYILGEAYFGRMNEAAMSATDEGFRFGYFWVRLVLTIGWGLLPLVYFIDRFGGGIGEWSMNITYNLGDLVNKVLFAMVILSTGLRHAQDRR